MCHGMKYFWERAFKWASSFQAASSFGAASWQRVPGQWVEVTTGTEVGGTDLDGTVGLTRDYCYLSNVYSQKILHNLEVASIFGKSFAGWSDVQIEAITFIHLDVQYGIEYIPLNISG